MLKNVKIQRNTRMNGIPPTPTDAILESISDGVFTVDLEWRITSFNRAAEEITGMSRKEAIGRLCPEVFRSSMCEAECALRRTLKTGRPVIGRSGFIIDADGTRIPNHPFPQNEKTGYLPSRAGRPYPSGAETVAHPHHHSVPSVAQQQPCAISTRSSLVKNNL
jgi:PAS domain S-box-containing protein